MGEQVTVIVPDGLAGHPVLDDLDTALPQAVLHHVDASGDIHPLPASAAAESFLLFHCLTELKQPHQFMDTVHNGLSPDGSVLLVEQCLGPTDPVLTAEELWQMMSGFRTRAVFTFEHKSDGSGLFAFASPRLFQPRHIQEVEGDLSAAGYTQGIATALYKSVPLATQGELASYLSMAEQPGNQEIVARKGVVEKITSLFARSHRKPRIVLVHPPFIRRPEAPTTSDRVVIHGLGLISSYAKQQGCDISLIDNRMLNDWDLFQARLDEAKPDIVGIGTASADWSMAEQCIARIRNSAPRSRIVVGGPHPSLATSQVAANANIDHIVIGDGELTFVELVQALSCGQTPRRIIHGRKPDLDMLPFVDRDIFQGNEHRMPPLWYGEGPWVSMITSRGCMFNCSFCAPASKIMFGKTVRRRSPANVIKELELLRDKYAFNHVRFYDDNIIESRSWAQEFCRLYRETGFSATFGLAGRADLICQREDLIALLAATGMNELNIGFESGSQKILDLLNKRTTVQNNIEAARILKKHGVKVIVSVMFGIPEESHQDIDKTVELIDLTQPDWVDPSFLTPYPGTTIHEYCKEKGLDLVRESSAYNRGHGSSPKIRGADYTYAIERLGKRFGPRVNWQP